MDAPEEKGNKRERLGRFANLPSCLELVFIAIMLVAALIAVLLER